LPKGMGKDRISKKRNMSRMRKRKTQSQIWRDLVRLVRLVSQMRMMLYCKQGSRTRQRSKVRVRVRKSKMSRSGAHQKARVQSKAKNRSNRSKLNSPLNKLNRPIMQSRKKLKKAPLRPLLRRHDRNDLGLNFEPSHLPS
jgi:hypothetical protein